MIAPKSIHPQITATLPRHLQGVINGQTMSYDTLPCDSNCTHCST